jgi:hypothetical protein
MSTSDDGIREQIAEAERIAFENSAPLSLQQLTDLFSRLNAKSQCDHTFSDTRIFAEQHRLDVGRLVLWLQERGAHCDCEVVYNVYDEFGLLVGWHLSETRLVD